MNAKLKQHLSVPENRLMYAFDFLLNHGPDFRLQQVRTMLLLNGLTTLTPLRHTTDD